ncbi:oligosaccharide flippase family protein [Photobacterium aquimaris]|uniref:Uncharacterized protein n=1 Tax=Photobacterium aquimaris TaxID=512643 RepID=A0A2T3HYA9_9GAMM|nr:oligosaccharide flippase family protein [Photobacterium aquimaris]OBU24853.1 hypothetical protein AYY21_10130 [Photobacterium aquimaris]PQJ41695.1 hypothetical protein BTN98_08780 [Photobacterium aquimaris]PSU04882.1 hypothetical protein C0W81_09115 [Photobacterium aquimaris]
MKKYLLNIGVILFDRVAMLVFQIWMASYYVQTLGISNYGQWSYTLNMITIIISIFILGIDVIVIKDIVNNKNKTGEYIYSGILIQLVGFIFVLITTLIIFDHSDLVIKVAMASILVANLFIILSKSFYWNYSALVESKYRTIAIVISFLIFIPVVSIYLSVIKTKEYVLFVYAIYYVIQFVVSWVVNKFLFKAPYTFSINSDKCKEYSKVGISLILSTLSVMLFTQTDVLMIKYFIGNAATGEFSAATRLSTSIFILAGILANTFYPKIIKLSNEKKIQFIKVAITTVTLFCIVGSLITMLISPYLTSSLYGDNSNISLVLSFHIWCSLFIFSGAFTSRYLYANEFYKVEIVKTILAAIVNIGLNLYTIPTFGIIGAVGSSFIAYLIANYLSLIIFKESRILFITQSKAYILMFNPIQYVKELKGIKCLFQ